MSKPTIALNTLATGDDSRSSAALSRRAAVRAISGGLTAAAALAGVPRIAKAGPEHTQVNSVESIVPEAVLGAWDVSFRRFYVTDPGSPERALVTFAPERALVNFTSDGGFQAASAPISVAPDGRVHFNSGGLGGWSASDIDSVAAHYTILIYDEIGDFAGVRTVNIRVQPDQAHGTLTGAYYSQRYDFEGELTDFVSGTLSAVPARARGILRAPTRSPEIGPVPVARNLDNLPPLPGLPGEPY